MAQQYRQATARIRVLVGAVILGLAVGFFVATLGNATRPEAFAIFGLYVVGTIFFLHGLWGLQEDNLS